MPTTLTLGPTSAGTTQKYFVAWIGPTTAVNVTNFPWFTSANVAGIYGISTNRLGYVSNKPGAGLPSVTQFALAPVGSPPNIYELDLKAQITLTSDLVYLLPSNQVPTVVFAPLTNAPLVVGTEKDYLALAMDVDGTVKQVDLVQVTSATDLTVKAVLGSDTAAPYTFGWIPQATGTVFLAARVTDNLGAQGFSTVLPVSVQAAGSGVGINLLSTYGSQSNGVRCVPTADNTDLNGSYPNFNIYNDTNAKFEPLQVGGPNDNTAGITWPTATFGSTQYFGIQVALAVAAARRYPNKVFHYIQFGYGGTTLQEYLPGGDHYDEKLAYWKRAMDTLQALGQPVTHWFNFFNQWEGNYQDTSAQYQQRLEDHFFNATYGLYNAPVYPLGAAVPTVLTLANTNRTADGGSTPSPDWAKAARQAQVNEIAAHTQLRYIDPNGRYTYQPDPQQVHYTRASMLQQGEDAFDANVRGTNALPAGDTATGSNAGSSSVPYIFVEAEGDGWTDTGATWQIDASNAALYPNRGTNADKAAYTSTVGAIRSRTVTATSIGMLIPRYGGGGVIRLRIQNASGTEVYNQTFDLNLPGQNQLAGYPDGSTPQLSYAGTGADATYTVSASCVSGTAIFDALLLKGTAPAATAGTSTGTGSGSTSTGGSGSTGSTGTTDKSGSADTAEAYPAAGDVLVDNGNTYRTSATDQEYGHTLMGAKLDRTKATVLHLLYDGTHLNGLLGLHTAAVAPPTYQAAYAINLETTASAFTGACGVRQSQGSSVNTDKLTVANCVSGTRYGIRAKPGKDASGNFQYSLDIVANSGSGWLQVGTFGVYGGDLYKMLSVIGHPDARVLDLRSGPDV